MRFELIAKTDEKIILKYSKRGGSLNRYKEKIECLKYLELIGIDCKYKVLLNRFIPKQAVVNYYLLIVIFIMVLKYVI